MTDYPTLVLPAEGFFGGDGDEEVLRGLAWKALLQLPKKGRELTRSLARSGEAKGMDEIVDLVDTNAFAHEKGGKVWNLVFPGAAVSFSFFSFFLSLSLFGGVRWWGRETIGG
jgi:hypothetical protein